MNLKSCRDCLDRSVGCHIDCERYKADVAANEAVKEARRSEWMKDNYQISSNMRRRKMVKGLDKKRRGY